MRLHNHFFFLGNIIYITFWVDVRPLKVFSCFQYTITLINRLQLMFLNGSIIRLPYGQHEINFLTEEALDHYLFLNPSVWDDNDGGTDEDEEDY